MNPQYCKRNTIAYVPAFHFRDGNVGPKFFILLDDIDEETDTVIVATFTSKLKYKNKQWTIFVRKGYFKEVLKESFPREDSLLDCNTCQEMPSKYIRSGKCKYVIRARNGWLGKAYKAMEYAYKIEPYLIVKLKARLNLK